MWLHHGDRVRAAEPKSVYMAAVRKKMKGKAYARTVRWEDITEGAALLGLEVDQHIANWIAALQAIHEELGL